MSDLAQQKDAPKSVVKHHRPVQSGLSVLARGESFVWLTGGMLVVAIGMIVTLLGFIVIRGASTFWPQPFAVYPTHNGSFVAGEPQSTESFNYDASQVQSLSDSAKKLALAKLSNRDFGTAQRVYLRVGNFDLSGQHFAYLNEFERSTKSPFYPEALWVVERLHNGRFYGWPVQLREQFSPQFDASYRQISSASELVPILAGYANEQVVLDASQAESITAQLQAVRQASAQKYMKNVREQTPLNSSEFWEYQSPDGSWKRVPDESIPSDAQAIRLVANAYSAIRSAFETAQRSIVGLVARSEELQEELARNDERLRDARLELRQTEIDFNVTVLDRLSEFETSWSTISIAKAQLEGQRASLKAIQQSPSVSDDDKAKLTSLFGLMEEDINSQISQMEAAIEESLAAFETIPHACKDAIDVYRQAVMESAKSQVELNTRIADTESEIKSASIVFQASQTESVQDVAPENAKPLVEASGAQKVADGVWWLTSTSDNGTTARLITQNNDAWREATLQSAEIEVAEIVRAYTPNTLTLSGKFEIMLSRWGEFLTGLPREAGMEGGFFPAIWGTIVMTMIMALFVVPFGVLAALYLREYASNGLVVGILRIAINNLAGVPSVVYGVFGLAFFCYIVGGYIDGGPDRAGIVALPPWQWYVALGVVAGISLTAFFLSLYCSGSPMAMGPGRRFGKSISGLVWVLAVVGFVFLIAKSPFFDGFYQANLPNPTFGKGGLIWASLTLALLTLPVVIVATEEALAAVPNSLREGSYACGAGKWQTIQRIVLPHARPGIMTGTILAMARGAGEVAPMMLVGALPLAIELPLDGEFPFFHGSRSFMHLGFQIYALGFQGQNSEAAKPMVFTTTLLLILIVLLLNLVAIILRTRLRKRFQGVQF